MNQFLDTALDAGVAISAFNFVTAVLNLLSKFAERGALKEEIKVLREKLGLRDEELIGKDKVIDRKKSQIKSLSDQIIKLKEEKHEVTL